MKKAVKTLRKILISIVLLSFLMIIAGLFYVWYMGRNSEEKIIDQTQTSVQKNTVSERSKIADNAPNSASIQSISSPLNPGSKASIIAKTNPNSECVISVTYNKIVSNSAGLSPAMADDWGVVVWKWTIEDSAPIGKWPVKITCVWHERAAVVIGDLNIVKN